jgi:Mg/Co/Ni transporter MgtE
MPEALTLALDFLDEHPDVAVRTLEQLDAVHVTDFLRQVPASYSVAVLKSSLPAFAAHLCSLLGVEASARLLLEQDVSRMVAVLRHLEHGFVDAVLKECPQARRQACHLLMRYTLDRVGAWMVPNTAVVTQDFSAADVLTFLKDATEETFGKYVYIVSRDGIPKGRISYLQLLKAAPDAMVASLMETDVNTISADLSLAYTVQLPCWSHGDVMPVVGLQQQFIGVLRHVDLRKGLHQLTGRPEASAHAGDPVSGIVDVYGKALLALFNTVTDVVEAGPKGSRIKGSE